MLFFSHESSKLVADVLREVFRFGRTRPFNKNTYIQLTQINTFAKIGVNTILIHPNMKIINVLSIHKLYTTLIALIVCVNSVTAQESSSATLVQNQTVTSTSADTTENEPPAELRPSNTNAHLTDREFTLSIIILGFGLMVIMIVFFVGTRQPNPDGVFKLTTVTLVITSSLFLVIAGYSSEQIAPVIGLLGTIAGYLLGKASDSNDKKP